jgi:hypothetical protein
VGGQDLEAAVPDGEGLRYVDELRRRGAVGLTDERMLLAGEDEEPTSVELTAIESVEFEDLDYFEGVLGVALVGFGVASASRSVPLAALFVALGVASLYLTYRKRSQIRVNVHSRPKPLKLYPADGQELYDAFERALDDYQRRLDAQAVSGEDAPRSGEQ